MAAGHPARLALSSTRLRAAGGARVTLTALLDSGTNLSGTGWIDWDRRSAYLVVDDLDAPRRRTLLRHSGGHTTQTELPVTADTSVEPVEPPLPVPTTGWRAAPAAGLPALLNATLRAAVTVPGDAARLIRNDRLAGTELDVVEVAVTGAPMRYWLDRSGLPHRIQRQTAAGTWAQVDLIPGPVPLVDATRRVPPER